MSEHSQEHEGCVDVQFHFSPSSYMDMVKQTGQPANSKVIKMAFGSAYVHAKTPTALDNSQSDFTTAHIWGYLG